MFCEAFADAYGLLAAFGDDVGLVLAVEEGEGEGYAAVAAD